MLILGGEFFWAVRSLGSSIVQAPKNWMKPSAQNYNHKPQESFTFLYEKKCGESAFLSVLDMHDLNVLWISCVTSNRCAKNCLMIHKVFNTVKTQGELDNTAKLTVKQFESWIFFMMLHLDLQRFGWVKKKELGRVFEAAGSVVLAFFAMSCFSPCLLWMYICSSTCFFFVWKEEICKKTDKTNKERDLAKKMLLAIKLVVLMAITLKQDPCKSQLRMFTLWLVLESGTNWIKACQLFTSWKQWPSGSNSDIRYKLHQSVLCLFCLSNALSQKLAKTCKRLGMSCTK